VIEVHGYSVYYLKVLAKTVLLNSLDWCGNISMLNLLDVPKNLLFNKTNNLRLPGIYLIRRVPDFGD